ncbi:glycosyltransferase [Clostridium butyricum]|uniref:Alpha-D-kanosaminyltransferase n=1 Tax=Clostridium butyricum TaxID=1492 RepID=A0A6N3BUR8_CLOBU
MKIGFLIEDAFSVGGVQRVTSVLANGLSEQNEVSLICTRCKINEINRKIYNLREDIDIQIVDRLKNENLLIRCVRKILKEINKKTGIFNNVKSLNILTEIYFPKKFRKSIVEFININKYDVVIGVEGLQSILLGCIAENLNSKVLGWQHNSYEAYLKNKGKYYWNLDVFFNEYINKLNDYVVLTKHDQEQFLLEKNMNSTVIFNPRSFTSNEKSSLNKKTFLAAGRFTYQKGFDLLIESFNEFVKNNSDWNLVIVGEGEERHKIENLISSYNLEDRVTIDDFTENIKEYFMESSILLLASRWEGMPMIVLESLEMGVPVISYDISAINGLVYDNVNGVIVDKFDTKKFAQCMNEICTSKEKIKFYSQNCLEISNDFKLEKILEDWNDILLRH